MKTNIAFKQVMDEREGAQVIIKAGAQIRYIPQSVQWVHRYN